MSDRSKPHHRSSGPIDTGSLAEMGLLRRAPEPAGGLQQRHWNVDVYLDDCVISGALEGTQRRLTDYLQAIEDQITLEDVVVRSLRSGKEMLRKQTAVISVPGILFIVDQEIAPTSAESPLHVAKRPEETMLHVGPFWIKGHIHVPQAGNLNHYIRSSAGAFIPITGIRISGHDHQTGRTALINRTHLQVMLL